MKNIIIIGTGRAGKTTLAKMLNEAFHYSVIGMDDLHIAFEEGMPSAQIGAFFGHEASAVRIEPFLASYVSALAWRSNFDNGTKYVFDDGKGYFDFDRLVPIWEKIEPHTDYWKEQYHIIGLTYNRLSPEALFADIRTHDSADDWTRNLDDDALMKHAVSCVEYSRNLEARFKKYHPVLYDVSENRAQVLEGIVRDVGNLLR